MGFENLNIEKKLLELEKSVNLSNPYKINAIYALVGGIIITYSIKPIYIYKKVIKKKQQSLKLDYLRFSLVSLIISSLIFAFLCIRFK